MRRRSRSALLGSASSLPLSPAVECVGAPSPMRGRRSGWICPLLAAATAVACGGCTGSSSRARLAAAATSRMRLSSCSVRPMGHACRVEACEGEGLEC